ncbi:uncharacterized protein SOCE836_024180 [Sorangium cellulosum]|uniref:Uncharacterized protein n=1 Tax=Sorangium cellulosum TaxID=56 RepID=A0A4P2QKM6_SORCE|nr:uncharacterized protein SOCE836_024180 [Sorangium cellulosum]
MSTSNRAELGDASVPFEFDVHAMIWSEDAPALENALHREFHYRRVNLIMRGRSSSTSRSMRSRRLCANCTAISFALTFAMSPSVPRWTTAAPSSCPGTSTPAMRGAAPRPTPAPARGAAPIGSGAMCSTAAAPSSSSSSCWMVNDHSPAHVPQAQQAEAAPSTTRDRQHRHGRAPMALHSFPGLPALAAAAAGHSSQPFETIQDYFCVSESFSSCRRPPRTRSRRAGRPGPQAAASRAGPAPSPAPRAPAGDLHAGGDVGVDRAFRRLLLRPATRRRRPLLLLHRVANLRRRRAPR